MHRPLHRCSLEVLREVQRLLRLALEVCRSLRQDLLLRRLPGIALEVWSHLRLLFLGVCLRLLSQPLFRLQGWSLELCRPSHRLQLLLRLQLSQRRLLLQLQGRPVERRPSQHLLLPALVVRLWRLLDLLEWLRLRLVLHLL